LFSLVVSIKWLNVMDERVHYIYLIYKELRQKVYGYKSTAPLTERNIKIAVSYLKKLDKEYGYGAVGKDFLWSFMLYSTIKWLSLDREFILLNILSKTSLENWKQKKDGYIEMLYNRIIVPYNLRYPFTVISKEYDLLSINNFEEDEKNRYRSDIKRQLIHCVESTSLYNNKSSICVKCEVKEYCLVIQKENLPLVFNKRDNSLM